NRELIIRIALFGTWKKILKKVHIANGVVTDRSWKRVCVGDAKILKEKIHTGNGVFTDRSWKRLCVGDVTVNLDGETNNKIKRCMECTLCVDETVEFNKFKAIIKYEDPNPSIYSFVGNLELGDEGEKASRVCFTSASKHSQGKRVSQESNSGYNGHESDSYSDMYKSENAKHKMEQGKDRMKEGAHEMKEVPMDGMKEANEKVKHKATEMKDKTKDMASNAADRAGEMKENVKGKANEMAG
nr:probable phospholipid-transporting ATPase 4 [Tanacetum cinerariifolium]